MRARGICPTGYVYPDGVAITRDCVAANAWAAAPTTECVALVATNCTQPLLVTLPATSSLATAAGRALPVTAIVSLAPGCAVGTPTLRFEWRLDGAVTPAANASVLAALNRNSTTVTIPSNVYANGPASPQSHNRYVVANLLRRLLCLWRIKPFTGSSRARTQWH